MERRESAKIKENEMANNACMAHIIGNRQVISTTERTDQGIGQVEIIDTCGGCGTKRVIKVSREGNIGCDASSVWISA